jgi:hypothetical protein
MPQESGPAFQNYAVIYLLLPALARILHTVWGMLLWRGRVALSHVEAPASVSTRTPTPIRLACTREPGAVPPVREVYLGVYFKSRGANRLAYHSEIAG